MTVRDVYDAVLIELQKEKAPSLLLDDFIYYLNKAITAYVNKRYNLFEVTQQLTDDLRVLKVYKTLDAIKTNSDIESYHCEIPNDYLHLLDCWCYFNNPNYNNDKCPNDKSEQYIIKKASKLSSGMYSNIINNYYFKPSIKKPYYALYQNTEFVQPRTGGSKTKGSRKSNQQKVMLEIRCGNADLTKVGIEYLKSPQYVSITHSQIEDIIDTSDKLEFPDYVCNEIINELVALIMGTISDNRLQSYIPLNTTIAQKG